jgi:hypothetical protein
LLRKLAGKNRVLGHIARKLLGAGALALVLAGTGSPLLAQRLRTGTPPTTTDDVGRDNGWQGIGPVDPPIADTLSAPASDAEAAGLRPALPPAQPGESRTIGAQRERARTESRRAPWNAQPIRPGALPPDTGVAAPPPGTPASLRPSARPAPMANRRTGRVPPRPALPAATARQTGLRPLTPAISRAPVSLAPSRDDARALDRGLRGVATPVQPRRPVDVPIVTERTQLPSGRVLPNANPLGRATVIDPRTGEVVSYDRRAQPEADPFAPTGIRLGSFIVTPTVDATIGYDSNPRRLPSGGSGSLFTQSYGEVQARSDWSRHELTARLRGTYSAYFSDPGVNRPEVNAVVTGRVDVSRDTRVEGEARYLLNTNSPGSSNLPSSPDGLRNLPLIHQSGATLGVVQDFGRLQLSLRGTFDRYIYDDAVTNAGTVLPQGERNYNAMGARLRASYELTPGLRPFVEAAIDQRRFDQRVSTGGTLQGSTATTYRVGTTFELTRHHRRDLRRLPRPRQSRADLRRHRRPGLRRLAGLDRHCPHDGPLHGEVADRRELHDRRLRNRAPGRLAGARTRLPPLALGHGEVGLRARHLPRHRPRRPAHRRLRRADLPRLAQPADPRRAPPRDASVQRGRAELLGQRGAVRPQAAALACG